MAHYIKYFSAVDDGPDCGHSTPRSRTLYPNACILLAMIMVTIVAALTSSIAIALSIHLSMPLVADRQNGATWGWSIDVNQHCSKQHRC